MTSVPTANGCSTKRSASPISSSQGGKKQGDVVAASARAAVEEGNLARQAPLRASRAQPILLPMTPPPLFRATPDAPRRRDRIVFPTPLSPTSPSSQSHIRLVRTPLEREDEGYIADASSSEYSEDSREVPSRIGPRRLSFEGRLRSSSSYALRPANEALVTDPPTAYFNPSATGVGLRQMRPYRRQNTPGL